jgi:predicted PurR-regulated permease PerM
LNNKIDFGRSNKLLLFLFLLFGGLYFARSFMVPVTLAILFAMLMAGLANRMERKGLSRGLSTTLCTLILVVSFTGTIYLISDEVAEFAQDLPNLKHRVTDNLTSLQNTIESRWGIAPARQMEFLRSRSTTMIDNLGAIVQKLLEVVADVIRYFVLITVYVILMLSYRDKFYLFVLKLVPSVKHEHTRDVVNRSTEVAEKYLLGKLLLVVILFGAYAAGYTIIGLDHGIFLAMIAAVLSIVPIIGTIVGGLIPVVMAMMTGSPGIAAGAVVVFLAAQIMENYILTPLVVGNKVNLNPLFTIMAVILGGALWGAIGMIVFIPLLGIVKIICDNISSLEPIGYLIGKEAPKRRLSIVDRFKKRFGKKKV